MLSKKILALTLLVAILGGALLTACAGGASIDVNVDPETGQGTIDIVGSEQGQQDGGGQSSAGGIGTDNAIMIAIIVALFLAIIALVVALVGRRPSA